jgi:hypothetical protein
MLAINPIDRYMIDLLSTVSTPESFDEELSIAHQNIILMASLNGGADNVLHLARREQHHARFRVQNALDTIKNFDPESIDSKYVLCL